MIYCNSFFVVIGSRCRSPSPSQPPISREQALLESFFHALSQFAFDKAKDQVVCDFYCQYENHVNTIL